MYSLIMFDMDGTLLNTFEGLMNSINDTLDHFGEKKLSKKEMEPLIGPRIYDTFRNVFNKTHEESIEMTEWFRDNYVREHLFEATVYPGVIDSLKKIRSIGYKMTIITNKRYDYMKILVEHFGLQPYFDGLYGTDFENSLKKHDLIDRCLSDFNVKPGNALMIGDTIYDLSAAEKQNIDFIPVSYGFGKWDGNYSIDRLDGWLMNRE